MAFTITPSHIEQYRNCGYTVFQGVLPTSLIEDLRRACIKGVALAREQRGPSAQRFQPVNKYDIDQQPFRDYAELPDLNAAVQTLLTPQHRFGRPDFLGVLIEPAEHPWCTNWHRDFRDHMEPEVFEDEFRQEWDAQVADSTVYMAQINCALYTDVATWFVPGSVYRQRNTVEETAHVAARSREDLTWQAGDADADVERRCLEYCRQMPGAMRIVLDPGDFCIYRPCGWHLGNYVPTMRRATLHDGAFTDEMGIYYTARWERLAAARKRLGIGS